MPSTRDIRRRIKSVKNTSQITRAMQLVAASKMKKAQELAMASRPYARALAETVSRLHKRDPDFNHNLMRPKRSSLNLKPLAIVVTSDKGLCGALNSNLLRDFTRSFPIKDEVDVVSVGKKGRNFLVRLGYNLVADFEMNDPPTFSQSKVISRFVSERFLENKCSKVLVAFPDFISTLQQEPTVEEFLPLHRIGVSLNIKGKRDIETKADELKEAVDFPFMGYIYEPSANEILNHLLPQLLNFRLFQQLLESRASEHSARMVAMKAATDNAKDLIDSLTLEYNKIRQAAITNELLDISTAMRTLG